MPVAELDSMPEARANALLAECCGSSRWIRAMVSRRPFESLEAVLSAADEIWRGLGRHDWLEAFSHHPRIGERPSANTESGRTAAWAAGEQSRVQQANEETRSALAVANREYERRFGYIYIVCATGKSAEEMLALAGERLRNDPDVEVRLAAEEQRKIMRLRLEKLLDNGEGE